MSDALLVVGGGVEASALRVTIANDSTGAVTVDGTTKQDIVTPVSGSTDLTVKYAVVSEASIADNEVVAAVATKKIRVLSYVLNAAGGLNTATWKTAATALSGAMDLADNSSLSASAQFGLFETVAGEALNLALTAATLVAGHVSYVEV